MTGTTDGADGAKATLTVILGCDPQVAVTFTETDTGTLFVVVAPADPAQPVDDIDGVFFNLSDDSTLGSLNFFPDANDGSIFSPVTGIQAAADSVNTLSNGAQVADNYDVGIQFGTVDSSTAGNVAQANFTLWSDDGPLKISDIDVDSFATVVDSDAGAGQVLTASDTAGADPVLIDKTAVFENFDHIHDPAQSSAIASDDGWVVSNGKLATNSQYEGAVTFEPVATDGPVTFSMDAQACNIWAFENSGTMADSLKLEVRLDNGEWVLLDEFMVNDAGTAMVGSETGQTFDGSMDSLEYSGGILDTATESAQFRITSDTTACDEIIKIDNVEIGVKEAQDCATETVQSEALAEDFTGIWDPSHSDAVVRDDNWNIYNGELWTNGCQDGVLQLDAVESDGPTSISFDARACGIGNFEQGGYCADTLRLEVSLADGEWMLLDEFRVNDHGTEMVGSESGNTFGPHGATLEYSGGLLEDVDGKIEFRFVSDISANDEHILIDNISIETSEEVPCEDECTGQEDVGYIAGIPVLPWVEEEAPVKDEVVEEEEDMFV